MGPKQLAPVTKKRDLTSWLQGSSSKKEKPSDNDCSSDIEVLSPSPIPTDTENTGPDAGFAKGPCENTAPSPSMPPPAKKRKKNKAALSPTEGIEKPSSDPSSSKSPTKPTKNKGQQSIFGFCQVQKPASENTEEDKVKAARCYEDALNAIRNKKIFNYKQAIHSAKGLSEAAFADIDSDFFKYVVFPNTAVKNSLLKHPKFESNYVAWLEMMAHGAVEDSFITTPELPTLKAVSDAGASGELFGRCLAVTEFVETFAPFLGDECYISAADLMTALSRGCEGYYTVTSHLLTAFLLCFYELEVVKGVKFFNFRVENISWNHKSASEVLKAAFGMASKLEKGAVVDEFLKLLKQKRDDSKLTKLPPLGTELAKKFEAVDFHELEPSDQLDIFDFLMNAVMDTNTFNALFAEEPKRYPENFLEKKEAKLAELDKKVKSATVAKKYYFIQARSKIKKEMQDFHFQQKVEKTLKKVDFESQKFLGTDRFHRRYFFIRRRCNFGIFIESVPGSTPTPCFVESDALAAEISKFAHVTYAPTADSEFNQPQWFQITEVEELDALIEGLSAKGVRESELLANLKELHEQFGHSMRAHVKFEAKKRGRQFGYSPEGSDWSCIQADLHRVLKSASKGRFIHYSTNWDELFAAIDKVDSVKSAASTASNLLTNILPCAFPPMAPGKAFFRYQPMVACLKASTSLAQIHLLLQLVLTNIRGDNLFNMKCPRCDTKFKETSKIAACMGCFGFTHLKCVNPATEPNGEEPFWSCATCLGKTEPDNGMASENEDEKEETPEPLEDYVAGGRTLRHTRARQHAHEPSPTSTISEDNGRPRRAAANRRVFIDDSDSEEESHKKKAPKKEKPVKVVKPVIKEVQDRYDDLRDDYRAFQALQAVHFESFSYGNCTVLKMGEMLSEYGSLLEFEKDLKYLFAATLKHFERNPRKRDDMKAFVERFALESATDDESEAASVSSSGESDDDDDDLSDEVEESDHDEVEESDNDEIVSDNDE